MTYPTAEAIATMTATAATEAYNEIAAKLDRDPVKRFPSKAKAHERLAEIIADAKTAPRKVSDKTVKPAKTTYEPKEGSVAATLADTLADWVAGDEAAAAMNAVSTNGKVWTSATVWSSAMFQLVRKKGFGLERKDGKIRAVRA